MKSAVVVERGYDDNRYPKRSGCNVTIHHRKANNDRNQIAYDVLNGVAVYRGYGDWSLKFVVLLVN